MIRLYLALTNFCISGDGVAYLAMAQDFAAKDPAKALDSVFSPLYPWLVSLLHLAIPSWELAGNLLSAIFGTLAVAAIYALTRESFDRHDLAIGAGILAAIHPDLAAYSASVRTEAGFIFFMTTAIYLLMRGLKRGSLPTLAASGMVAGLAYLDRTEAIGLVVFAGGFMPAGALLWRNWNLRWAILAACTFVVAFLLVASPYLIYLRVSTGHWMIGRELTAAMMYGMGEVAHNTQQWQLRGYSKHLSPLMPLLTNPRLYWQKVAADFFASLYGMAQALGPILTVLLTIGLWSRGRNLLRNIPEAMILLLIAFYVSGFSFSYTGRRFMDHLIPYTFGWVMAGLETAAAAATRTFAAAGVGRISESALSIALVIVLLPQTLWPIGYDMRGIRYAGEEIARRSTGKSVAIVARDGRVAWYGGARFVLLPDDPAAGLCTWLAPQGDAAWLLLSDHDERRLGVTARTSCLIPIERYPRYGAAYYDLFAIQRSK